MSSDSRNHDLQHQAEHTRVNRRINVMGYLAVLFVVAFLLLGFAYLQQQRINKETTDALKDSSSAFQSIQDLIAENETLRKQVEQLEEERDIAKSSAEANDAALTDAQAAVAAMDYFWQIDEAYVRGRYTLCRQLIQALQDSGYEGALPNTKATDNDRFTPAARYAEIYDALY